MQQQYDQWQEYWDKFLLTRHGKEEVSSEDDLYLQVARTVNKKPIEKEAADKIVEKIFLALELKPEDVMVDFCCGNGLFTYELRNSVKQIIAVDFSQNIIDTANKYKSAANITYCLGSVTDYINQFDREWPSVSPNKYLMNDALAYFTGEDLEAMLTGITKVSGSFKFLLTGVPNDELKWNYYNTDERKAFYHELQAKGDLTNHGLGKWWSPDEITAICHKLKLKVEIRNQELPISDYRMDIVISN
jgi:SAM-dependent methyltransferase